MRIGYVCTKNKELMNHLVTAKQATDLHTNIFSQYMIHDYLLHNNHGEHINKIKELYRNQSTAMLEAIKEYFPNNVKVTTPQGGMFMWETLENGMTAVELFELAMKEKVAFVPGDSFYVDEENVKTLRLNYTNSDTTLIQKGIKILGSIL